MTIKEYNKDNLKHNDLYESIVNAIGINLLLPFLPFMYTKEQLKKEYEKDKYFNTIKLNTWKKLIVCGRTYSQCPNFKMNLHFRNVLKTIGITSFSLSDCICIMKACARIYIQE